MNRIDKLNKKLKVVYKYRIASNLIDWDLLTNGNENIVDELIDTQALFKTKIMKIKTSREFGRLLNGLLKENQYKKLSDVDKMTVTKLKKEYDQYKNVPIRFYTQYEKLMSKSQNVWEKAKKEKNYEKFEPYLKKVIDMSKKMTVYRKGKKENIYDLMLDDYEEGLNTKILDKLFKEIKEYVIKLIKDIEQGDYKEKSADTQKSENKFPIEKQRALSRFLLRYIGFDVENGTIGESEHPFTMSIALGDTRLTNHYYENDFINPVFSIIHEGGHGIFEQNINPKFRYTPMEIIENMGLHESQSRFYENILGKNINFWKPIFEKVKEILPEYEGDLEEFYKKINKVEPIAIRIDSDEVTYCLHIIIRYEIERDLFNGKISVKQLPEIWNKKMKEYLGVEVKNHSEGILQDSHWSAGNFGYFPTYLLGSIYDGMLLEKLEKDMGNVDKMLEKGGIKRITKWLNNNIHQYGGSIKPMELMEQLCGKEISAKPLIKYFKEKYERE